MNKVNIIRNLDQILGVNPVWAYGSAGCAAQVQMLVKILSGDLPLAARDNLMLTALSLIRWVWQHYPLDTGILQLTATLEEAGAKLGAMAAIAAEIRAAIAGAGGVSVNFENPDSLTEFLNALPDFTGKMALKARLMAGQALVHDPGNAEAAVESVDSSLFDLWKATAHLELARKRGAGFELELLKPVWNEFYWHTNLCLVLHDLLYSPEAEFDLRLKSVPPPPILLYSWNKCEALSQTLASLRKSQTEGAPVFVLDNGSTGSTFEMLKSYERDWGGPFKIIRLPANVGAPVARNWLLALPEVKSAEWAVFLDDDVILDPGWLQALCSTALANPGFGAVGCRVTDHIPPYGIQAADFHLLPPEEATHSFEDIDERVFPFCAAMGEVSESMYAYSRPCVSVTGCCHLLNMRAIERAGPFDVRFNPSQFDDLERDLRSSLAGFPTWYNGRIRVRHMQHSSLRQAMGIPQQAHIMGNKIKLEFLLDAKKADRLRQDNFERVKSDLLRKCAKVEQALGPAAGRKA